jgi:hypothetical protein
MADEGFLGGLLGGIGNAAQGVGSGLAGLLGGGQSGGPSSSDPLSQMSPEEQRRMSYSALGQLGAILLAAGQKQTPAQRGQILSQLGGIGPGMEQQIARSAALRGQQAEAAQRRELFPLQRQQLEGQLAGQRLTQQQLMQQMEAARASAAMRQRLIEGVGGMGGMPVAGGMPPAAEAPSYQPSFEQPPQQMGGAFAGAPVPPGGSAFAAQPPSEAPPQQAAPQISPQMQQQLQRLSPQEQSLLAALPREYVLQQLSDPSVKISDIFEKARQAMGETQKGATEQGNKLRTEFSRVADPFIQRQTAYETMIDLARNKAGASDMALVLSIMKVYDPVSTVTGGESATAQQAAGLPSQVVGYYNSLVGGGKLSDTARSQLVRAAETRFERELDTYSQTIDRYSGLASRAKVDPQDVVYDARNPDLLAAREQRKELARASKIAKPQEILSMDADTLQLLVLDEMTKPQRDAVNARIIQLQQQSMPQPPAAPVAMPQPGVVSPSTMPLGVGSFMRQRYPSRPGLRRDDELPPTGY